MVKNKFFIFAFFLALAEIEEWTNSQDEYIWIDDPISSLDDNNIFAIVSSLVELLEKIKIIILKVIKRNVKLLSQRTMPISFILLKKRIEKYRKNISYIFEIKQ